LPRIHGLARALRLVTTSSFTRSSRIVDQAGVRAAPPQTEMHWPVT
jgi:hypothetical protein